MEKRVGDLVRVRARGRCKGRGRGRVCGLGCTKPLTLTLALGPPGVDGEAVDAGLRRRRMACCAG